MAAAGRLRQEEGSEEGPAARLKLRSSGPLGGQAPPPPTSRAAGILGFRATCRNQRSSPRPPRQGAGRGHGQGDQATARAGPAGATPQPLLERDGGQGEQGHNASGARPTKRCRTPSWGALLWRADVPAPAPVDRTNRRALSCTTAVGGRHRLVSTAWRTPRSAPGGTRGAGRESATRSPGSHFGSFSRKRAAGGWSPGQ